MSALLALALAPAASGGGNLIVNGDFEAGITGWEWWGGDFTTVDDPTGVDHAGAITLTSSLAYLQQQVSIEPGATYRFSGQFVASYGPVTQVQPRLVVYNQSGEVHLDAGPLTLPPTTWDTNLDVPCNVVASGVARVAVYGTPGGVAYVDDIALELMPSTPCPTATPTPSDTPTITLTPTRTPTATKTPTSTRTPPAQTATAPPATSSPTRTVTPTLTPSNGLLSVAAVFRP